MIANKTIRLILLRPVKTALFIGWLILIWMSVSASAAAADNTAQANYKILHSFDGLNTGSDPYGVGVTIGKNGSIYGVALSGGKLPNGGYGNGVVYKINNVGKFSVLHFRRLSRRIARRGAHGGSGWQPIRHYLYGRQAAIRYGNGLPDRPRRKVPGDTQL